MRDIGKNIREMRERKRPTQDQLAQRLFVTRQTISNYETGRSRPDIETLLTLALDGMGLTAGAAGLVTGIPLYWPAVRLRFRLPALARGLWFVAGVAWELLRPRETKNTP